MHSVWTNYLNVSWYSIALKLSPQHYALLENMKKYHISHESVKLSRRVNFNVHIVPTLELRSFKASLKLKTLCSNGLFFNTLKQYVLNTNFKCITFDNLINIWNLNIYIYLFSEHY